MNRIFSFKKFTSESKKNIFTGAVPAEMTVFLSMVLLLVMSLLFALLETARFYGLRADADMSSMLETDNIAAEYDSELWKEYGLFFMDASYGSGTIDFPKLYGRVYAMAEKNLNPSSSSGMHLYRMHMTNANAQFYELATDDGGSAFRAQAVAYQKRTAAAGIADTIREKLTLSGQTESDGAYDEAAVDGANEAIATAAAEREAAKKAAEENGETYVEPQPPAIEFENPLDLFSTLKGNAVLGMVMPEGKTVSGKQITTEDCLQNRALQSGNYRQKNSVTKLDDLIFLSYLTDYYGNATDVNEQRSLDYELEYIIGGNKSDMENLEVVVNRLVLQRGAANLLYLHTDVGKCETALSIATALAGVSANPLLIAAVKEGILVSWAYVESLQDIRTLLSGGKVPLMKTSAEWKTDVLHPATSYAQGGTNPQAERGFSYEDYLLVQIALLNDKTVNYRAMDLIEKNVASNSNDRVVHMDCMIQRMDLSYDYEAETIFSRFVSIGNGSVGSYEFTREQTLSYL